MASGPRHPWEEPKELTQYMWLMVVFNSTISIIGTVMLVSVADLRRCDGEVLVERLVWIDLLLRVCLMLREFDGLFMCSLSRARRAIWSTEPDFLLGIGLKRTVACVAESLTVLGLLVESLLVITSPYCDTVGGTVVDTYDW